MPGVEFRLARKSATNRSCCRDLDGRRDLIRILVGHGRRRPKNPETARGPDFSKHPAGSDVESPFFGELRHLATYDLNKELLDDLKRGLTVIVGRGHSE